MLSNDLIKAMEDTLSDYWRDYSNEKKPTFLKEEEEINPVKCPAIGIFDDGSSVNFETMRGVDDEDTLQPGLVSEDYQYNLMVYLKGPTQSSLHTTMNNYRDSIKAILQDKFTLGTGGASVRVSNDEQDIPWTYGSAKMRVARTRVVVTSWTLQGSGELLEEADL